MGLEIDIHTFLHNLMATKPPYDCPFEGCGKTYKSHQGISYHLCNNHAYKDCDAAATGDEQRRKGRSLAVTSTARNRSPSGSDLGSTTAREALTYAEAQRMIEVDIDGRTHRINIAEPMSIIKYDKQLVGLQDLPLDPVSDPSSCQFLAIANGDEIRTKGKGAKNGVQGRGNKSKSGKKGQNSQTGKSSKAGKSSKSAVKSLTPEKPKLPEPSYRVVDDPIEVPDVAEPRSSAYFRFIEKSPEELDESVEYDMDEEDCAWLELINKDRKSHKFAEIPPDVFEMLMDRLEKESYFLSQNSKDPVAQVIDENAVCCICNDGDCQNSNAILFCDMCDLAVHQECYGVPYIPEGQWLCRRCLHSPSAAVDCILCPNKGGAFKQTDKGAWAHVVCALWIPEVCFANTVFLEPIDSTENIPAARWRLLCYICKQKNVGACIQCHRINCYVAFHVTCAQSAGLFMKIDFDKTGAQSIRKAAYCHTHTPADEAVGTSALSGVYITGDTDDDTSRSSFKSKKKSHSKSIDKSCVNESEFKEKIRKTRRILAEKRSELPKVSIPTIPPDRLTAIAAKVRLPKRNQFIQRLLGYWTLKRQSRNGVPLLRRLQISYMGNRRAETFDTDSEQIKKTREMLKYVQRLRQDLEKARLLVELIRKREKVKRQCIDALQELTIMRMAPFRLFLLHVLSLLEAKDVNKYFAVPVTAEEAPDYHTFISQPMDFSTMRSKAEQHLYPSFDSFEKDFNLIVENCKSYNDPSTPFFKAAAKMRDNCRSIFADARRRMSLIRFNEAAGVHMSDSDPVAAIEDRSGPTGALAICAPEPADVTSAEEESLAAKLADLKELMNKAYMQKSGGSRSKKIKTLQAAIDEFNDKLHHLNPSRYPLLTDEEKQNELKQRRSEALSRRPGGTPSSTEPSTPSKSLSVYASDKVTTVTDTSADVYQFETPTKPDSKRKRAASTVSDSAGAFKKTPVSKSQTLDKRRTVSEKSAKNKASLVSAFPLPLSPGLSDDVFEQRLSPKKSKAKPADPIKFTADQPPCLFGGPMAKKSRLSTPKSQSSKSKKRSSSNDVPSLSLAANIMPQKDSFKVYRSTANSSDDSDARSATSSSAASTRSRSGSESAKNQPEQPVVTNGFKSACSPTSLRSASRLSSDGSLEDISRIALEHLDLVWAKSTTKKFPFIPALVIDIEASKSCPHISFYDSPPLDINSKKKRGAEHLVCFLFGPLDKSWHWMTRKKLEPLGNLKNSDDLKKSLPRKATDQKLLEKAYEKALLFHQKVRVTHEGNAADLLSEESGDESD